MANNNSKQEPVITDELRQKGYDGIESRNTCWIVSSSQGNPPYYVGKKEHEVSWDEGEVCGIGKRVFRPTPPRPRGGRRTRTRKHTVARRQRRRQSRRQTRH